MNARTNWMRFPIPMPRPADITGLILAGGGSRRFGSDKALAEIVGATCVERAAGALTPLVSETLIATGPTARDYPANARVVLDPVADGGPLAGLAAGLRAATTPWLLVVPVDLPFLTAKSLARLLDASNRGPDGVVAVDPDGRIQPATALLRIASALPIALAHLTEGRLALRDLIAALDVKPVRLSAAALRNVNRPSEKGTY